MRAHLADRDIAAQRRPDRHPDRHLQRPAPRLPVPGQPARRPARRPGQRRRRHRGLLLGRDLGLGRAADRRRLRGRAGDPLPPAPVSPAPAAPRPGASSPPARPPLRGAPAALHPARPQPRLPGLPVPDRHRLPGLRHRPQPRAGAHPHRQPHRPARHPRRPLESGGEDVEAGLNLRWSATPNVALNVAVNPDFSQVEADAAQLNVNERFALFFPEKRPFFLEGADLFSTPLDAVFTRSVADPSFGLKLSGKQGKSAFGVFAAEDRINNLIFPSFETSSLGSVDQDVRSAVVRYRRDLGATSTLGVLYAGRESDDYHNHVYGLDGTLRPTDSDTVRFQVLGSNTLYPDAVAVANDQPVGGFDGTAWQVNYTHNSRHWFWQAFREELDPEFRADSGFITRVGANNTILNFDRIFWGGADSPFSQIKFGCAYQILDTTDGRNLEHSGNVVTVYQGRWKQFRVAFGLRPNRESFADVRFDDMRADMRISIRPSGSFYGELFLRGGDDIDVVNIRRIHFKLFQPRVEFKLGRRLDGEVQDQFQTFNFHGEEYLRANLAQTTLRYHLNVRTFFRGIFQYRTVDRDLALYNPGINLNAREKEFFTQLLFSYKINPQTVLLAGYSDDDQANDRVPDLTQKNRTFFLKVGYAFLF